MKKKSLDEFIEIYKKEYGVELTEKEAIEKASKVLQLYKAILDDPLLPDNKKL